ncbi:MAG TPA: type II secretion system protein GspJ [Polyangiaceae bacterium]|nr:type II secretion system protein GspJ [Polyangiaceae bacterium]
MNARVARSRRRGLTLLEVLVSIAIMAMVSLLAYGAFDGLSKSKQGLSRVNERFHEGRGAMRRIAHELSSAYLSLHQPLSPALVTSRTAFVARDTTPADRLDMTTFSHRRVIANSRESDQNELSYFGSPDPNAPGKIDLARREQAVVDYDPQRGGTVQVLVEDIERFDLRFLDPVSGLWTDSWDSNNATAQFNRLPAQVRVTLTLRGRPGARAVKLDQKVTVPVQTPLMFALPPGLLPGTLPGGGSGRDGSTGGTGRDGATGTSTAPPSGGGAPR